VRSSEALRKMSVSAGRMAGASEAMEGPESRIGRKGIGR
jgi:hypothetical protein